MLARVLLCLVSFTCTIAAEPRPNVILIQLQTPVADAQVLDVDKGLIEKWQHTHGSYLASPGRSATQTALLFGTPPLQHGVVKDLDWRRKPIAAPTLADRFRKSGYHTQFYGAWALGSTAPYSPKSRGFDQTASFEAANSNTLADSWGLTELKAMLENKEPNKPLFVVMAEGRHLSRAVIVQRLNDWLEKNKSPAVVMILESDTTQKNQYHHSAKWRCFTTEKIKQPENIVTDWDINHAIRKMLNWKAEPKPSHTIYHKANWPINESPEKYRHRGSLVLGDGLVLTDGLNLFAAKNQSPDHTREMDISKHQKEHQTLLTAHAQWWQKASKAIQDPRPFTVGKKDNQATQLTAQDWRTTKIIGPDTKSPLSAPMIEQKKLLAILDGLKTNAKYKETFPAYSGSWSVNITRPGRYKISASLLPKDTKNPTQKELMKLQGGTAHIKLGRNKVQLQLHKGASSVSVKIDADAGVTDLECWFTGQLALARELGAFFVEIERIGDKKFDLNAKPATE